MEEIFVTFPHVGYHVWTEGGLREHGPLEGPKINVPPSTGGIIVAEEKPYRTMDVLLYVVKWDSGQVTKHYFNELFCIGPFESLADFEKALQSGHSAELTLGPSGGFREFKMSIRAQGRDLQIRLVAAQRDLWMYLEPIIHKYGVVIKQHKLPYKRKVKKGQRP